MIYCFLLDMLMKNEFNGSVHFPERPLQRGKQPRLFHPDNSPSLVSRVSAFDSPELYSRWFAFKPLGSKQITGCWVNLNEFIA